MTTAVEQQVFTCNICGEEGRPPASFGREAQDCACGSRPRWRALIHALSVALYGESLSLTDMPANPLKGIGLTDFPCYADRLARAFDYRVTYYDREPRLDITDPPPAMFGTLDFLISSDVFEHVASPVERAFRASYELLKPGGVLVLTVPTLGLHETETIEHFPDLHDYEIVERDGARVLVNRTVSGDVQEHTDLRFHGGYSLEMRVFSHRDILRQLEDAGFSEITEWTEAQPQIGVPWSGRAALPIVAQR